MRLEDCPEWEYDERENRKTVLQREVEALLHELADWPLKTSSELADTRPLHHQLFRELTPNCCPYFAGEYRGSGFLCLQDYHVAMATRSGVEPALVAGTMERLGMELIELLRQTDKDLLHLEKYDIGRLTYVVTVACGVFMEFTTIHPYANGNGHVGRFMLIAILYRYGYQVTRFEVEPRPGHPYNYCVLEWENGRAAPLLEYVMNCIS